MSDKILIRFSLFLLAALFLSQSANAMIASEVGRTEANPRILFLKIQREQYMRSWNPTVDFKDRAKSVLQMRDSGHQAAVALALEERGPLRTPAPAPAEPEAAAPPAATPGAAPAPATVGDIESEIAGYCLFGGLILGGIMAAYLAWSFTKLNKQKKIEAERLAALCREQETRALARSKRTSKLAEKLDEK